MGNQAVYELEAGNVYRPTRHAGSPWSESMQHGGAIIGLFAREIERASAETGMHVARLTVDLFKAVPMETLVAETRVVREGRRIAAIESTLSPLDSDAPVARASGLLLRAQQHDHPSWASPESPPPCPSSTESPPPYTASERRSWLPGFHKSIVVRPGRDHMGSYVWVKTKLDLVADEAISPFQLAAAMTDMTLGSQMAAARRRAAKASGGGALPALGARMINADSTSYWERPFTGDWLGMRPSLISERDGVGTASAVLYDAAGRVGTSMSSALIADRANKPGVRIEVAPSH